MELRLYCRGLDCREHLGSDCGRWHDISGLAAGTTITSLRVDPIGGAGANSNSETNANTFDVDFIRITAVPEPSAALLFGIGVVGLLRRRR